VLPANWGPKSAARMQLDKDTKLDKKKVAQKNRQRRNEDSGQPSKRAKIRENRRLKRNETEETESGENQ